MAYLFSYIQDMNAGQYKLLKAFPKDKSYLSHSQLEEIMGGEIDYDDLTSAYNTIYKEGFIEGRLPTPGLRITDKGLLGISDYELTEHRKAEIEELNFLKLKFDAKNAERVYKTYKTTRVITWITFIVMLILSALKLAEVWHIWPYHK